MDSKSLKPYGAALWAYFEGESDAELIVRRDDGQEGRLPVSYFYRGPQQFTAIEKGAIERCESPVLDVGAGTGLHSLALQQRGLRVTAIDIDPQAVTIMSGRGAADARCADLFDLSEGPYETLLMLGHGIGMVETLAGLDRFLGHVRGLLSESGQILVDSLDVTATADPKNLVYLEANRQADRYVGETRVQFEYGGEKGPYCGWLHVDPATLAEHAVGSGWTCQVIVEQDSGDYLAKLVKTPEPDTSRSRSV